VNYWRRLHAPGNAHGKSSEPRTINAKELLQFRFILPPKQIIFTKLVKLRVLDSPQSAESSMYQPVVIGIYIAQQNDGRANHAEDSRIA
jgi:hypothetical protein